MGPSRIIELIELRGGVVATIRKAIDVLRREGVSGVGHRLRALTSPPLLFDIPKFDGNKEPFVSIIVPNYNHAAYLEQRLDTILAQTYQHFELILLDDCSTDGSLEILRRYEQAHPDKIRLVVNDENSGGGYRQWAKGMSLARGDLIWIAESDDWSGPEFLESLIPAFEDESIMLAYTNSAFMDAEGKSVIWSTPEYLNDVDRRLWTKPFQRAAHELVRKGWATKNLVPNVSGAVFRNPGRASALLSGDWSRATICGDWLFYLERIRGGGVAYRPEMLNFYRVHDASTAQGTYARDVYYKEHEQVARFALEHYDVPPDFVDRQEANLRAHWQRFRSEEPVSKLKDCYDPAKLTAAGTERTPNILMAGFAFAAGGGETFPIFLANLLKAKGYAVTFLSCECLPREEGVRSLLSPDIPVVTQVNKLADIVREFGIDIIHSHHGWVDSTVLRGVSRRSPVKTVVSMHGMYELMEPIDQDALVPRLFSRSSALVFTSQKNLGPFERLGLADSPKIIGIPNALPAVPITPVDRSQLGIPADAFLLCLVSRALPEKGWAEAIEAVERARAKSGRDIRLLLIGEGPEFDRLSPPGSVGDFVQLLGFRKNLRDYFAASDLGFLPSRFKGESFPLTLIDCLAAGTPFLVSNVGEARLMLDAGGELAGQTFDLDDWRLPVEEMADIISSLAARGPDYARMKAATARAYSKFDPDVMVSRYMDVYDRIMRGEDPRAPSMAAAAE